MKRAVTIFLLIFLVGLGIVSRAEEAELTAHFIHMESTSGEKAGDCTVVISPDGKVMLIDAGETSCGPQVVEALKDLGVTTIDVFLFSHAHIDHIGGASAVMEAFPVLQVYHNEVEYITSETYLRTMADIERHGIPHQIVKAGDTIALGEEVTVDILWPQAEIEYYDGFPENSTQFMNNHSVVAKMMYKESSFLFAGDVYTLTERELVEIYGDTLKVDVHKVNHHGDTSSSSLTWRKVVLPQIAVVMDDSLQDHRLLEKYQERGATVYHTYFDGTVSVSTQGDGNYQVSTTMQRPETFLP